MKLFRSIGCKIAVILLPISMVASTPAFSQVGTDPGTYEYCLDNYERCQDTYPGGGGDAGMSQCGVWFNQCLAWGYWPGY